MMLDVKEIETWYGAIQALKGISLDVNQGEIVSLLGANGAGKSTTIKTITGLLAPAKGRIEFMGQVITGKEPEDIAEIGIACVPEGRRIFPGLTVLDNLMLGATPRKNAPQADIQKDLDRVYEIFPQLKESRKRLGWTLSGGQQQMLAIGRGLMSGSKLLLLDEPSLGLAPVLVQEVFRVIKEINKAGYDHPAGGAERPDGAPDRQPRVRAGNGQDDADRYGGQSAGKRRDEGALPGRPCPRQGGASAPTR